MNVLDLLWRPRVEEADAVRPVVLGGGRSDVRVTVDGWGWVALRPVGARWTRPQWFAGRTSFTWRAPADRALVVRAFNLFGWTSRAARLESAEDASPVPLPAPDAPALPGPVALPVAPVRLAAPIGWAFPAVLPRFGRVRLAASRVSLPRWVARIKVPRFKFPRVYHVVVAPQPVRSQRGDSDGHG